MCVSWSNNGDVYNIITINPSGPIDPKTRTISSNCNRKTRAIWVDYKVSKKYLHQTRCDDSSWELVKGWEWRYKEWYNNYWTETNLQIWTRQQLKKHFMFEMSKNYVFIITKRALQYVYRLQCKPWCYNIICVCVCFFLFWIIYRPASAKSRNIGSEFWALTLKTK